MAEDATVHYLTGLRAVRERAGLVLEAAKKGDLTHFEYNAKVMPEIADTVAGVITEWQRDFGPDRYNEIPPHGRWQHFEVGGVPRINEMIEKWDCDKVEVVRRLIDLFFVSVLLDAGAGDDWKFIEEVSGDVYNRSEGIAVASLYMFIQGGFSSDLESEVPQVDGVGLSKLTVDEFSKFFQLSETNPIIGASSRVSLLKNIGSSLLRQPEIYGPEGRPGLLVDYMLEQQKTTGKLDYETMWYTLQKLLLPAWPGDRTVVHGCPIGDAWPLQVLSKQASLGQQPKPEDSIQPFHKLTQWLAYSLQTPFVRVLGLEWVNGNLGTGLPEYRNGGVFVDMGALQLKDEVLKRGLSASNNDLPSFAANDEVIVEWRAMTVALLDELHKLIKERFSQYGVDLSLAQMLEAGSWKCGRELAAKFRPETRSSPILVQGDGTLF
ncbi:Fc.00g115660.m01.CDS01 [Cosmosporella sp. VM-42]